MALSREQLHSLAKLGSSARISELEAEIAAIRPAFSGVGAKTRRARGRKRRKMSAAAKKAVSVRMKKYWAAKRATKK